MYIIKVYNMLNDKHTYCKLLERKLSRLCVLLLLSDIKAGLKSILEQMTRLSSKFLNFSLIFQKL